MNLQLQNYHWGKKLHVIISKALTAFKLGLNDNYILTINFQTLFNI